MANPLWEIEEENNDSSGTVFRDVLMLALTGFVAIVLMLLPHLSKSTEKTSEHQEPGNVIVEMRWPSNHPVDVDLWVKAPGDIAVGFYNQGSKIFNLLRDDLGKKGDATDLNYEVSYSRGIPAGEYVVNAHMYGPLALGATVPVNIVVSTRKNLGEVRQILTTEILVVRHNQEITAFRFRLTDSGDLVTDSVTTLRRRLVTLPWSWRQTDKDQL